jgi:hypothetical protein
MSKLLPSSLGLTQKYTAPSSWWEHVPLAHWLVEYLQPDVIVELGTHYGVSFFSFCEAAQAYSERTFVYAIDTWEGDSQAGFYDNRVYNQVKANQKANHQRQSRLIRSTFDEAAEHFPDASIDLIHIDGLHTYEAVSHDYHVWKAKLKQGGTILFHDCNVREADFGVWKLWQEIKEQGEVQWMEIRNGHGLGIATMTKERPAWHGELENYLPALQVKGGLLNNLAQAREDLAVANEKLDTSHRHADNLETVIENLKMLNKSKDDHIECIVQQIESIESENRRLIARLEYLSRNRLLRLFDRMRRGLSRGNQ